MNNEVDTVQAYIPLAAATAGTDADVFVGYAGFGKAKLVYLGYLSDGGVTANDTNYATFTATIGAVTVATEATTTSDTGDIADGTMEEFALSSTGSNLVSQGGRVKVAITKAASGVAIAGYIVAGWQRVRAD